MKTKLILVAAAMTLLGACNYANEHGSQELPPINRLVTEPSGMTAYFIRTGLSLETPGDISDGVEKDDVVRIMHEGRVQYEGPLNELPQIALGTYRFAR